MWLCHRGDGGVLGDGGPAVTGDCPHPRVRLPTAGHPLHPGGLSALSEGHQHDVPGRPDNGCGHRAL